MQSAVYARAERVSVRRAQVDAQEFRWELRNLRGLSAFL
jgi:hypothetical protein